MKRIVSLVCAAVLALGLSVPALAVDEVLPVGQLTIEQCEKYGVDPMSHNVVFEGWCVENGTYRVVAEEGTKATVSCALTYDANGALIDIGIEGWYDDLIYVDDSVAEVVLSNCTLEYVGQEEVVDTSWMPQVSNEIVANEFD